MLERYHWFNLILNNIAELDNPVLLRTWLPDHF